MLNQGQTDKEVKFYAKTFGGTVFITKNGEIVYGLPSSEKATSGAYDITYNGWDVFISKFSFSSLPSMPNQSQGQGSGTDNQGTSNASGLKTAPGLQNAPCLQRK